MMFARTFLNATTGLVWHDGENSSVLREDGRYFGHAVKSKQWRVYGALKPDAANDELAYLGRFKTRAEAKEALSTAVAPLVSREEVAKIQHPLVVEDRPLVRTAGR